MDTEDCGLDQDYRLDNDDIDEYIPYKQIKGKKNKKKHLKGTIIIRQMFV